MRTPLRIPLVVLWIGLLPMGTVLFAQDAGSDQAKEEQTNATGSNNDDKEKAFDEIVKDLEKLDGLFTFYWDPDEAKVLIEIPPEQFDKDFLYSSKMSVGAGEKGLFGTIMADTFAFQWRRLGKRVQFVNRNLRFRAEPGSPSSRALANSFSDSVLTSAPILSKPHPERESVLVDAGALFASWDMHNMEPRLKRAYDTPYKFDKDNSAVIMIKSFPENSEIGVQMQFNTTEPKESVVLPDARRLAVQFHISLVDLPEDGYMPRIADGRVGHFPEVFMDLTSDRRETPYVRYVRRWKLEKKDPAATVSDPVEPIVFWIENTIPIEYRDAMREGVLLWDDAFERIGFRNAIVVNQQPDDADWDPADIRYNTIRWFAGYNATFAIGPSHSDPRSGQLIDADIGFSEGIVRLGARRRYELGVHPVQGVGQWIEEAHAPIDARAMCEYGTGAADRASFALDILAMRPDWNPEEEEKFIRQFLVDVTAHEVGHTLGFRHNFRASTIHQQEDLGDVDLTRRNGLSASVMDYNPPIVALDGETQGDYVPMNVGSYDRWAVEYAYKPIPDAQTPEEELDELRAIATRSAEPLLPYATDEDAGLNARAIDPRNTRFDFTDRPLEWFRHELRLTQELWANAEKRLAAEGDSLEVLRRAILPSWRPFFVGSHVAAKYIGGVYHDRAHQGDPGASTPFRPVAAADQRAALEFLAEEIWSPGVVQLGHELLRKLQVERQSDFERTAGRTQRLDYALHETAENSQAEILNDLFDPIRLNRILDLQLMFAPDEERFTMVDLYEGVREALWSELDTASPIDSFRRNLQRKHLQTLAEQILRPKAGLPGDAAALARADLLRIESAAGAALTRNTFDSMTRAHVGDMRARIRKALDAPAATMLLPAPPRPQP